LKSVARTFAMLLPLAIIIAASWHLVALARGAELSAMLPALVGSLLLVFLTALISVPLGIAAAVYLQEYAPRTRLTALMEWNMGALAGIPSIVYGLVGLELFVRTLATGRSLLSGALTLSLLVLPMIVLASREALRQVPLAYREAAFALGATRLDAIRHVVLPMGARSIATGIVIALGIALGEAAPLIVVGGFAYVTFAPSSLSSAYTALPLQIFHWLARPEPEYVARVAGAMIVLLIMVLSLSLCSIVIRVRAR
jgi:phosphate transport system permease protein